MPPLRRRFRRRPRKNFRNKLWRRNRAKSRFTPNIGKQVHWFKQCVTKSNITSQITQAETNYSFALNDLDQVTTFTALFDCYRINKIVLKFTPAINQNYVSGGGVNAVTNFYSAIDHDDVTTLGATPLPLLRQFGTCQTANTMRAHTRVIVPKVADTVYRTNVTSAYAEGKARQWIDCAYPDVPHYGLRTVMDATSGVGTQGYNVVAFYYIAFKNVR